MCASMDGECNHDQKDWLILMQIFFGFYFFFIFIGCSASDNKVQGDYWDSRTTKSNPRKHSLLHHQPS